ncbi:CoA transferase [Steroidobacter agaridevorans]|uniref:CoA transferase n=1 Tax=Steroidobacter agaridevorans TaxID=2695856 RepID=A0A829YGZ7_9GAMM|nr:CoA transferase [Steroidobacter agaridevorans]GFE82078.1 CoA transferase [Steroidobacter agaridevorans]GFE85534.1 CoA transferase [Steroidobacter agaridevorans]
MAGYDFLRGLRVLEVAQLGPSSLGGYLADMGAEVIKIEGADGDPVRHTGSPAIGAPDGVGLLHLRWNRGKKSVGVNLASEQGRHVFRRLAATCDVVIEGMRAGFLERLGLGFDTLRADNRKLVFCSLSGLGSTGPYRTLGSHAPAFDAFAALSSTNLYALTSAERANADWAPIGMNAMGLNAALGTLAAIIRARATGEGAMIEVTGAESAAHWLPDGVDRALNAGQSHERPGFAHEDGRMIGWPRLHAYETSDGRQIFFQATRPKFWERFCQAVERVDLLAATDELIFRELTTIFRTRAAGEWMALFLSKGIAGGPVNTVESLATDPHFLARDNVYEVRGSDGNVLRLATTPVKTSGQRFAPELAPEQWQHTQQVLAATLALDAEEMRGLLSQGAIYSRERR